MVEEAFRLWNTTLSSLPEVPQPLLELLPHLGALLKRGKVRGQPMEIISATENPGHRVFSAFGIWICKSEISNFSDHLIPSLHRHALQDNAAVFPIIESYLLLGAAQALNPLSAAIQV